VVLGAALFAPAGCALYEEAPPEETGAARDELFGRDVWAEVGKYPVAPFAAAMMHRNGFFARTMAVAPAFERCVAATMNAQYMNCVDPDPGLPRSVQISNAWTRVRNSHAHNEYDYDPNGTGFSAAVLPGSESSAFGTQHVRLGFSFNPEDSLWDGLTGPEPWHWFASLPIHEFMHNLGYHHVDNYPNGEEVRRDCVEANGRPSYYAQGEPSAVRIYDLCGEALVLQSFDICGDLRVGCGVGRLRLLSTWTGVFSDAQPPSATCECVRDPRHMIALRSNATGSMVTALNRGGGALRTDAGVDIGPKQWLSVMDSNGGASWSGTDPVSMKSWSGPLVRRNAAGLFDAASPVPFYLQLAPSIPGTIEDGDVVRLQAGSWFAREIDGSLASASASLATSFTVVEPRRDHLVYLKTIHRADDGAELYVSYDDSGLLFDATTSATLSEDSMLGAAGGAYAKAAAAFWIVDWNGKTLRDGDVVSLESLHRSAYVSVATGDHLGQARLATAAGPYERFVINIADGSTGDVTYTNDGNASNDHHRVTFRTAINRFLTAMPPDELGYEFQIRSHGTTEGWWQQFGIIFVQEYDRHRPTW
jgi:hypothetical protein